MLDAGFGAVDHGVRPCPGHQLAIGQIRPIGENLFHDRQTGSAPSVEQLRCGRSQQNQISIDCPNRAAKRVSDTTVDAGKIVQCAVWLDMGHPGRFERGYTGERPDLKCDLSFELGRSERHGAATEALQIRIARMGSYRNATRFCQTNRAAHCFRITGVPSTSDVGRTDDIEHGFVVAHAPGTKTFTEVGVEVNRRVGHRTLRQ